MDSYVHVDGWSAGQYFSFVESDLRMAAVRLSLEFSDATWWEAHCIPSFRGYPLVMPR